MKHVIRISFILILFFEGMNAFAQTESAPRSEGAKSYIGISGGVSVPLGDFATADFNDPNSGFATTGANFNLDAVHYFHKNVGLGILLGYSGWGYDPQALSDGFLEAFEVDSTTLNVDGNNSAMYALIGPYVSFPFGNFTLDLRLLSGYTYTTLPGYEVFLEDGLDNSFGQKKANAGAIAMQPGAGLRYAITDNFGIALRADYYISRPVFEIENFNRTNNAGRLIDSYTASINSFNATIGVLYQFGK